ncbi:IPT/TIG domain-containing protein [Streptomyces antimycoticus]|uniref:IPT/TIG domain-containing protein n=1 Tax=Streptomyces antimycoticus TaxID=68175 RepID=UPI0034494720
MAPLITSISPTQSHHAVPMTITGTGLSRVIRVNFDTRPVTPTSVTSTTVTCMIPELPAGQYNVSVTDGSLTSNSLPFYYIGPPKVTSVTPNTGPLTATSLSVFGENLITTTSVAFGDAGVATDVVIASNTTLTVVTPEHAPLEPGTCTDTVDVVVTTAGGTSFSTGAGSQYTYYDAPVVTGMRPSSASVGSTFTLSGSCLLGATRVTFTPTAGGQLVQADYVVLSPAQISAIVPPHLSQNTYNVRVTTPGGPSPIAPEAVFTVIG